ncbi:hypothetical protein [Thalassotalea sp. G2M2-11]|uniref:hypothetical protein n=1 Tax=Thalassotalea sp. G2M2-11 TaxID=2787627 RepID=UPI0019D18AAA|nr:hypothetical protein [Thalassotalea sp. G2M2-11]
MTSHAYASNQDKLAVFVKNEMNGDDYINGVGVEVWLSEPDTELALAFNTSLGTAEITDSQQYQQSYVSWDFGVKFGYFSDVFFYGEIGVDMAELVLQDRDEDEHDDVYDNETLLLEIADAFLFDEKRKRYDQANDIDAYLGVGVGINIEQFAIEAFARSRQIDGEYWKADNQIFTGIKLSVIF